MKKDGESDDSLTRVAIVWSELIVAMALGTSVVVYQRLRLLGVNLERLSCKRIWQWARPTNFQTQTPHQISHIMCRLERFPWHLLMKR